MRDVACAGQGVLGRVVVLWMAQCVSLSCSHVTCGVGIVFGECEPLPLR